MHSSAWPCQVILGSISDCWTPELVDCLSCVNAFACAGHVRRIASAYESSFLIGASIAHCRSATHAGDSDAMNASCLDSDTGHEGCHPHNRSADESLACSSWDNRNVQRSRTAEAARSRGDWKAYDSTSDAAAPDIPDQPTARRGLGGVEVHSKYGGQYSTRNSLGAVQACSSPFQRCSHGRGFLRAASLPTEQAEGYQPESEPEAGELTGADAEELSEPSSSLLLQPHENGGGCGAAAEAVADRCGEAAMAEREADKSGVIGGWLWQPMLWAGFKRGIRRRAQVDLM